MDLPARRRDRRGRGQRGPAVLPSALATHPPLPRLRRQAFDRAVLDVVSDIDERWAEHLGPIEYAVEDIPVLPDDWDSGQVPLASVVHAQKGAPARLVVFRRPIEHRCPDRTDMEALVLTVVVEQVADLLGIAPSEVDPRYAEDDAE
ncbi:MAG: metallopeptidase family protein [Nocardioidaceae bacterium]|nr:metallopeptidase family protein [Nocardioidaceae bacterium]